MTDINIQERKLGALLYLDGIIRRLSEATEDEDKESEFYQGVAYAGSLLEGLRERLLEDLSND